MMRHRTSSSIALLLTTALTACVGNGGSPGPSTLDLELARLNASSAQGEAGEGTRTLQAIRDGELSGLVAGNTITGSQDGAEWYEFHGTDGRVHGWSEASGAYEADYVFTSQTICYDYPGEDEDGCWAIGAADGSYYATNTSTQVAAGPMALLPGNPMQLGTGL